MKRCLSAIAACFALALAGGVTKAYAGDPVGALVPATAGTPAPAVQLPQSSNAASAVPAPAAPVAQAQPATATPAPQGPTNQTQSTNTNNALAPSHSQTTPQGPTTNHGPSQAGNASQIEVPIASPATQVNIANDNQVLTYESHNGDFEANNQSQENNGSTTQKTDSRSGGACCTTSHDGSSKKDESGSSQILVPVASPATQVSALNDNQVLTYKSSNGDFEANNQSQESKGARSSSKREESCGCPSSNGYEGKSYDRKDSGSGSDQILVPIGSPATQVNIANDNQVLTYKSHNGDFEANNQSQEQSSDRSRNDSYGKESCENRCGNDNGYERKGCERKPDYSHNSYEPKGSPNSCEQCRCKPKPKCEPPREEKCKREDSYSKNERGGGKQILVPILSPATQVNIANDNQVLTYKSSNGDFEANNQSQES